MFRKLLYFTFSILIVFGTIAGITVFASSSCPNKTSDELKNLSESELNDYIEKCSGKVESLQNSATTLSNEIASLDSQINLTQARVQNSISKINKTQQDLVKLGQNIEDIKLRLTKLQNSMDYQKQILDARLRKRYKLQESSPVIVIFGSETINQVIQKAEYLQFMELQDNKMLNEMAKTKIAYNKQQGIFEDKKNETEDLKKTLEAEKKQLDVYKAQLDDQKSDKQNLLASTQEDEQKYQALLDKAQDVLASYKNFVQSAGGGQIGANEFGTGKEGWYYSQRDSRWAGKKIGKSSDTIFEVGCLLTSVAMIYKYHGESATPQTIAADSSRYLYPTANMLIPWKGPGGRSYREITKSQIDTEIKSRPVIVGVYAGPYGTHFVVLAKKSGSDYIMYDPYYGPDLKFSSRYSTSSIFQAVVFK